MFLSILRKDLLLIFRTPSAVLNPLVFFIVVISLFPLGVGPSAELLQTIAPGVVWVAALLATMMSMDLMFREDFDDGSLEQYVASGQSVLVFVLAKAMVHWLVAGLPLVFLMPVIGLVMFLDVGGIWTLALSLLLVSPTLSLLGAIGAALSVGLPRGGLLVTILVLPFYVPVLVLATAMVQTAVSGGDVIGFVYWLLAILLFTLTFAPLATSAAVRLAADQ